jgi:hypothetical protein
MIYFVELFFRAGRGGGMLIGLYFLIAINEAINRHVSFISALLIFTMCLQGLMILAGLVYLVMTLVSLGDNREISLSPSPSPSLCYNMVSSTELIVCEFMNAVAFLQVLGLIPLALLGCLVLSPIDLPGTLIVLHLPKPIWDLLS